MDTLQCIHTVGWVTERASEKTATIISETSFSDTCRKRINEAKWWVPVCTYAWT